MPNGLRANSHVAAPRCRVDVPTGPFKNAHRTPQTTRRPICWPFASHALARSAARLSSTPAINPPRTARRRVHGEESVSASSTRIFALRRREQIESLHTLDFMLLGPPGAGKTHLALGRAGAAAEHRESTVSLNLANAASRLCATASCELCLPPAPNLCPYFFFVVNRNGRLTHAATGFDTGPSV